MKEDLERVKSWAKDKIQGGSEPPWAWYQYMKLIEATEAILLGMDATIPMGSSPQLEQHSGAHLRLVGATGPQDIALPRHVGLPVQMPT